VNRLRVLLLLAVAFLAPALASCSGMPTITVPKEVLVPVPVPCVDPAKRPLRPALTPIDDLMAMDRATRTLFAWSSLERLTGYTAELEAVVEGCSRIPIPANSAGGAGMQKK